MGLDTVELAMRIEETFDITINDRDAEKIGTVGQAYRYILDRIELSAAAPCRSASQFYRIRRALIATTGVVRRSLRPSTRLNDVLPETGRREAWERLGDQAGLTIPRLQLMPLLGLGAFLLSLIPVVGWVGVWGTVGGFPADWFLFRVLVPLPLWAVSLALAYRMFRPLASEIPPECRTIRTLVLATLGQIPRSLEGEPTGWHPNEVWTVLLDLVSELAGIERDRITEETHFVHDLGMD
jgi:acyl carrier protein